MQASVCLFWYPLNVGLQGLSLPVLRSTSAKVKTGFHGRSTLTQHKIGACLTRLTSPHNRTTLSDAGIALQGCRHLGPNPVKKWAPELSQKTLLHVLGHHRC